MQRDSALPSGFSTSGSSRKNLRRTFTPRAPDTWNLLELFWRALHSPGTEMFPQPLAMGGALFKNPKFAKPFRSAMENPLFSSGGFNPGKFVDMERVGSELNKQRDLIVQLIARSRINPEKMMENFLKSLHGKGVAQNIQPWRGAGQQAAKDVETLGEKALLAVLLSGIVP